MHDALLLCMTVPESLTLIALTWCEAEGSRKMHACSNKAFFRYCQHTLSEEGLPKEKALVIRLPAPKASIQVSAEFRPVGYP